MESGAPYVFFETIDARAVASDPNTHDPMVIVWPPSTRSSHATGGPRRIQPPLQSTTGSTTRACLGGLSIACRAMPRYHRRSNAPRSRDHCSCSRRQYQQHHHDVTARPSPTRAGRRAAWPSPRRVAVVVRVVLAIAPDAHGLLAGDIDRWLDADSITESATS